MLACRLGVNVSLLDILFLYVCVCVCVCVCVSQSVNLHGGLHIGCGY